MNKIALTILLLFSLLFLHKKTKAQLSGNNLSEFQFGNLPNLEPKDQSSIYDQLNLMYRYKNLSLTTRAEFYTPSFGEDLNYLRLSQYKASYTTRSLNLDVGHMYNSFGRGLLMRNYEIPGSIYEDRSYRVRYGFYKDMHGVAAKYKSKHFSAKAMRGEILTVDLPPTLDEKDRRTDLVEGVEMEGNYEGHSLGLVFMRHHNNSNKSNYGSIFYNKSFNAFSFYGELAKRIDSIASMPDFSAEQGYGAYLGANYASLIIGASLEFKNYNNFAIGNGVNDPPTLVKEHNARLLNRSTHVPLLFNETGYQAEVYFNLNNGNTLTVNHALSQNKLATNSFLFQEYYIQYDFNILTKHSIKTFIDYAKDPLKNETNRYTTGATIDLIHKQLNSTLTVEYQTIVRDINEKYELSNWFLSYTLAKAQKFSISALLELTNDPYEGSENKQVIFYPATTVSYHFDKKNKLSAFYGKRRGGPACTSGVCYDVLDFEGFELRLNTRF